MGYTFLHVCSGAMHATMQVNLGCWSWREGMWEGIGADQRMWTLIREVPLFILMSTKRIRGAV